MGRYRDATTSNATASGELQVKVARRIEKTLNAAEAPMARLRERETIAGREALDALSAVHRADASVDVLLYELLAAVILGGTSTTEVSREVRISPTLLTRHLPRSLTDLRGRHLRIDRSAPHGWAEATS
ncbi:hypothetical protein G9444_0755 [Rhodococcus erythropolis]|uniref:Uncharacterized protein n=1 Tax=Rhodococcus erythropolis TaxID=1833 RepID=A0A6G9CMB4_RHOER|nr:hypothetical protein [Rhodococcus erythropolis]QIP37999.1 hypothetical protein G9444_0755 [Rhodococcus erythropolis]